MQIAVLAGGASRRMGRDKLRLPWRDGDLLTHVVACARATGMPVLVLGGERRFPGCTLLPDREPGAGPLPALRTALQHAGEPVLLLAADLPLLTTDLLDHLCTHAQGDQGLVVEGRQGLEPCCAIYPPRLLPLIDSLLDDGKRSLMALIASADLPRHRLPAADAAALHNVNTPEDWAVLARATSRPHDRKAGQGT